MNKGKRLHELTTAATASEEEEQTAQNILHYAYGSLSQMESVQEEIILDDVDEELTAGILRPGDCNPEIKDDNQCVDMVLEEEIITDTQQHDDGEELLMILSMNDDDERPPAPTITSLAGPVAVQSSEKATNQSSISQTQTTSSPTATILPLVKIVPNPSSENSNKIIMKIQAKVPPDVPPLDAHASQCLTGEGNGEKQQPDGDEDEEDEPTEEEEEEEASTTTLADEGKSVKVPREMKQLQQMVDSSKVLTDFMNIAGTTTMSPTGTTNKLTRKSRKTPGRPKKKVQEGATVSGAEHDSPKRTSARAMAAMEAADKKKRMFAEIGMDSSATGADDSTEIAPSFDADEISMDYHSDNETNESVASGYTDSMPMKLPKVNSNSSISIVPAPKVSKRHACPLYHLRLIPTLNRFQEGSDAFCWRCHTDGVQLCCNSCVRSFHTRCFRTAQGTNWQCPDCVNVEVAAKRTGNNLR